MPSLCIECPKLVFCFRTLDIADSLLGGDETLQRQLANFAVEAYFLGDQDIMREMDLTPNIFIVNRGLVKIIQKGKVLATLTKVRAWFWR